MTSGDASDRSLSVFYLSIESANTLMYALRSSFKTVRNAVGERRGNAARITPNERFSDTLKDGREIADASVARAIDDRK